MSKQEYAPTFRLGDIRLPVGVAVWPHLTVPDTKFKKEGEFRTNVKYTDEAKVAPIREKLDKFLDEAVEKFKEWLDDKGKKAKIKSLKRANLPVKPEVDEDGDETGATLVVAKRKASGERKDGTKWKAKLAFADSKGKLIPSKNLSIWGGSEIAIIGGVKGWYSPKDNEVGVSIEIDGIQIKRLVSGGERKVEFEEMEGDDGFSVDDLPDASDDDADDEDTATDSDDGASDDDDF